MRKLFILALWSVVCSSQTKNVSVIYDSNLIDITDEYGAVNILSCELITNNSESLYTCALKDTVFETVSLGEIESKKGNDFYHYKNLDSAAVTCVNPLLSSKPIKDSEYRISWELTENTKEILGYSCNEAKCKWRGRTYRAYYAPNLPVKNGPFKFDGLPGLILEVVSDDGSVKIKARSVNKTDVKISNPFNLSKGTITWASFIKLYSKKFEQFKSLSLGEGISQTIPKRYIEIYIE